MKGWWWKCGLGSQAEQEYLLTLEGNLFYFDTAAPDTLVADAQPRVVHSGGAVSRWSDAGPNARHISQGTGSAQPAWTGTEIDYDGSADVLKAALTNIINPANPHAIYIVYKHDTFATGSFQNLLDVAVDGQDDVYAIGLSDNAAYSNIFTGAQVGGAGTHSYITNELTAAADTNWHVLELHYNGSGGLTAGNFAFYRDNTLLAKRTDGAVGFGTDALSSGGNTGLSFYFNGKKRHASAFARDHIALGLRASVYAELVSRYGL